MGRKEIRLIRKNVCGTMRWYAENDLAQTFLRLLTTGKEERKSFSYTKRETLGVISKALDIKIIERESF